MKKIIALSLAALLLLSLCSCGGKQGKTSDNIDSEYNAAEVTETTEEQAKPINERLLEAVKPFQGEWKNTRINSRVIINNETVNFIYYDLMHEEAVSEIYTFYFALDDNEKLVVKNKHHQTRKILFIDDDGILVEKDSYTGDEEKNGRYEKVSDNTIVPEVAKIPCIGMTQEQVLSSTWGSPKKKNKTTTASGVTEQWVYDYGYIYFTNGYVTAIQE